MSRARANSSSTAAPRTHEPITSSERTGSRAVMLVLSDRAGAWFSDTLTMPL